MPSPRIGLALLVALTTPVVAVAQQAPAIQPDVVYGHKDGLALTLDVYRPSGDANGAGILFMVSGGWYSKWAPPEQLLPLFQPYLDAGFTLFAVRHGSSPRYGIPEAVDDVRRAVRHVRAHASQWDVDPQRLGVLGMSAGGHLALMLGTTGDDGGAGDDPVLRTASRVAAVVALVPPTDLRVAVWEAPESLPAYRGFPALNLPLDRAPAMSPVTHATADDAPALVIMGERDELVPPRHGEWMRDALAAAQVPHKLLILPNAGHGLEGDENRQTMLQEAVGWFQSHLLD
jgi:acetyl esterase/lipase